MKQILITLAALCISAQFTHAQWTTNGFNVYKTDPSGNVGIGTSAPDYTLDVNGTVRSSINLITPLINGTYIGNGINGNGASLAIGYNVLSGSAAINTGNSNLAVGNAVLSFNTTGKKNIGIGTNPLFSNTTGFSNIAMGIDALYFNTTGVQNIALGEHSLQTNISGVESLAIGGYTLYSATGSQNTAAGHGSGQEVTTGNNNTFFGYRAGIGITTGSNNLILGSSSISAPPSVRTGVTTGSNNTIIGTNVSGLSPETSNHIILADGQGQQRLVINEAGNAGIGTTTPNVKLEVIGSALFGGTQANLDPEAVGSIGFLANSGKCLIGWNRTAIEGETDFISNQGVGTIGGFAFYNYSNDGVQTEILKLKPSGNVGIGMTNPDEKLSVNGAIHAREVKVNLTDWPDYVFKTDYDLMELKDVKAYVDENHHLPNIPTAAEIDKNGLKLGEMNAKLLQKVEELTLYLIGQNKRIEDLENQVKNLHNK